MIDTGIPLAGLVEPKERRVPRSGDVYIHTKSGRHYKVVDIALNATNGKSSDKSLVIYQGVQDDKTLFARELYEFLDNNGEAYRFERLTPASYEAEKASSY